MAETYSLWAMGQERKGRGEAIPIEDPATGEIFAHCTAASAEDVDDVVRSAHAAFTSGIWSRAPRQTRADVLDAAATLLTAALPSLIPLEVRQTGRAVREMNAQVPTLVRWFRYYAALLRTEERPVLPTAGKLHNWVDRVPLGVVAQITPFNHPLLIAVKKLAPALAAGNSVVVKPSELTPLTTVKLGALLKEAGLPDGVFNVLPGYGYETGKALVEHPLVRKVDVTGGTVAGRAIGAIAGANLSRFTAELGGKAPVIVFDDAGVDVAVNGIVFGSFVASGQTCVASTRIIVHNSILPQVLEKLEAKVASITRRMGAPSNPATMMGPLISAKQLKNVETLVDDALSSGKATALTGGRRMSGTGELDGTDFSLGYYYPRRFSSFGPVIVVVGFETEDEAVALANDSEFGLGAAVWTRDLSRAHRVSGQIDAGIVWVNTHHRNDPSSPWGGATSASGVGSENGADAYRAYTTMKSTVVNWASADEALATDDWFGEAGGNVRYG
ncbi:aldehyde dehydrogenase domain-containing protein [Plectosphaerella cucumerina]|uniref:aldehyde dehydrogenase (NAD(+)) n=1 Tax=Plectosphaerella cucumerina TaxID=40658 RepID=A0A8K0X7X1_9PEZI|nr:aldehyde dehydrogenase domain-containing protein [Plectosphaerella cucumerina]